MSFLDRTARSLIDKLVNQGSIYETRPKMALYTSFNARYCKKSFNRKKRNIRNKMAKLSRQINRG